MNQALQELGDHIAAALPDHVLAVEQRLDELTVVINPAAIVGVLTFLRDDANCQFKLLMDVCGVDYPEREERFDSLPADAEAVKRYIRERSRAWQ